jgi:hypothetical protein
MDSEGDVSRSVGRPKIQYDQLKKRQKRSRTNGLLKTLEDFCEEEGASFNTLLAYLLQRHNYQEGKTFEAKMYQMIADGKNPFEELEKMSQDETLYLCDRLQLSRREYDELRAIFKSRIDLWSPYHLKQKVNELMPTLEPFMKGVKANLKEALTKTIQRTLEINPHPGFELGLGGYMTAKVACGFDGSGSHAQRTGKDVNVNTR